MNYVNITTLVQEMATQQEKIKKNNNSNIIAVSLSALYTIKQAIGNGKGMLRTCRKYCSSGQTHRVRIFLHDVEMKKTVDYNFL